MSDGEEWVSVTQAAGAAGVSERSLWRWVEKGRVVSRVSDTGAREVRLESVPRRGRVSVNGQGSQSEPAPGDRQVSDVAATTDSGDSGATDTTDTAQVAELRRQLAEVEGKARYYEVQAGLLDRARQTATAELQHARQAHAQETEFLRERLVGSEKAQEELRVLMLRQSEALEALTAAQRALPATTAPQEPAEEPARPWWRFWGR